LQLSSLVKKTALAARLGWNCTGSASGFAKTAF